MSLRQLGLPPAAPQRPRLRSLSQLVVAFGWSRPSLWVAAYRLPCCRRWRFAGVNCTEQRDAPRHLGHHSVPGQLCADDGTVMSDESAQSAQQLPDPALDTGNLAWCQGRASHAIFAASIYELGIILGALLTAFLADL
jgi:hypothetical protein